MYKLIAIDIDGTLLNNDKAITTENLEAIKKAMDKGIYLVLSTGRPIEGLEKYSTQLGMTSKRDFGIACSGALIKSLGNNKIIYESTLSYEEFRYLYEVSKELHITLNVLSRNVILTPTLNLTSQLESVLSNIKVMITDFENMDKDITMNRIVYINETAKFVNHLQNMLKKNKVNVPNYLGCFGNEALEFNKNIFPLKLLENFTVLQPSPYTFEVLTKGINKGSSVDLIAKSLGISKEEVICIGDSDNDRDMIEYAGLGVAMGNAVPEIKNISDYVTCTNEESGVAHVINKFIFEEEKEKAV